MRKHRKTKLSNRVEFTEAKFEIGKTFLLQIGDRVCMCEQVNITPKVKM